MQLQQQAANRMRRVFKAHSTARCRWQAIPAQRTPHAAADRTACTHSSGRLAWRRRQRIAASTASRPQQNPSGGQRQQFAHSSNLRAALSPRTHPVLEAAAGCLRRAAAVGLAALLAALCCTPEPAWALTKPSYEDLSRLHYARHRQVGSALPTSREAETIADLDKDLFTEEAYRGMLQIIKYARYVEAQNDDEEGPGCELCETNRITMEKAWQVVANEFYDAHEQFSQERWAQTLLQTLKEFGPLRTKHQLHAALEAMVATLEDPYSAWLPPSAFRRALSKPQPAEREYYFAALGSGVGLAIGRHSELGGWLIDAPLAESPAEEAGILRGDRLLQIDDWHVEGSGLTKDEVVSLLRGPAGVDVSLVVADAGGGTRRVMLERRPLPQPPIKQARLPLPGLVGGEVAYIRIHFFGSEVRKAVQQALLRGEVDGVDGYILDCRNNPGGVFEEAISIASLLIVPERPVAATVRTAGGFIDNTFMTGHLPREIFPGHPGMVSRAPVVLITNRATASAAEVLCGALRSNGRAVIVGEPTTFGKGDGSDGNECEVHGDGGLKLTVSKYLLGPDRVDISKEGGLRPDVACDAHPLRVPSADTDSCLRTSLRLLSQQQDAVAAPPLVASSADATG